MRAVVPHQNRALALMTDTAQHPRAVRDAARAMFLANTGFRRRSANVPALRLTRRMVRLTAVNYLAAMEVRQVQRVTPHDLQVELERWCTQIGGNRAVVGKWQAGAQGFLTQQFASAYLNVVLRRAKEARTSARRGGHLWHLLQGETGIKKVGLETLVYVPSNMKDGTSRNKVAAAIGKRAEFVLFLEHPYWKNSRHLDALRLVNGRALPMDLFRKRLIKLGIQKATGSFQPLTPVERGLWARSSWRSSPTARADPHGVGDPQAGADSDHRQVHGALLELSEELEKEPARLPSGLPADDGGAQGLEQADRRRLPDHDHPSDQRVVGTVGCDQQEPVPLRWGSVNTLQRQTFRKNREQVELQEERGNWGLVLASCHLGTDWRNPTARSTSQVITGSCSGNGVLTSARTPSAPASFTASLVGSVSKSSIASGLSGTWTSVAGSTNVGQPDQLPGQRSVPHPAGAEGRWPRSWPRERAVLGHR